MRLVFKFFIITFNIRALVLLNGVWNIGPEGFVQVINKEPTEASFSTPFAVGLHLSSRWFWPEPHKTLLQDSHCFAYTKNEIIGQPFSAPCLKVVWSSIYDLVFHFTKTSKSYEFYFLITPAPPLCFMSPHFSNLHFTCEADVPLLLSVSKISIWSWLYRVSLCGSLFPLLKRPTVSLKSRLFTNVIASVCILQYISELDPRTIFLP